MIALQQSAIFQEFAGKIRAPETVAVDPLRPTDIPRPASEINRIVAIDGSLVTETLRDGFPGAEASLVQLALVYVDLRKLKTEPAAKIIPPRAFNTMDTAHTLQTVLPGRNVVREDGLSPRDYFRVSVFEALQGKVVAQGHETLLETYESLVSGRDTPFKCPACGNEIIPTVGRSNCRCGAEVLSTDQLRFHERFNETGPNGEPHGEVMRFLEIVLLVNVLRYFLTSESAVRVLPDIAFVLDGPLAAFGQYASLAPYVKAELRRIHEESIKRTGRGLLIFSLIKTGQFVEHFERIDFDREKGPDSFFPRRVRFSQV
ncbi:DNA double-strand break repair nuclease NurA [Roseibium aggregatum]|uniref:DNA double-strand break repair nuclease NurA n=1 Tax=Roseibium aggregatum TaxID=187304 RepID=A0A939EI26_9HYPH|nr:DNA double-strand break repair nuclease NurA [Roseibium aggregatum]MBN9671964.1 DNA double-strand break repair nuclease NurA [Roseibium aggregatum]